MYRYDGWRDETLGGMKIPAVRNVSDVVFSKNLQVLTTLYGVSYRIKWDESEKFEDWKYFSRHRWVVDRGNDQDIKRVVPLFSNSHTNIILLFSDHGFSALAAFKNADLAQKSNLINNQVKSNKNWPRMAGLYSQHGSKPQFFSFLTYFPSLHFFHLFSEP